MKTRVINILIKLLTRIKFRTNKSYTVAIVKLDEIGDYILFRESIRRISAHHEGKIILIGNYAWKDFCINLDSDLIHHFIFIKKDKFSKSISYKFKIVKELRKFQIELLIHPTPSRDFFISDYIVSLIKAKKKIGFKSDLLNSNPWQLKISNRYYHYLVDCLQTEFELDKINTLINKINDNKITINKKSDHQITRKNYCVVFVGASNPDRRWNKYEDLIKLIRLRFDKIYICGGQDVSYTFNSNLGPNVINQIGKSSLMDFRELIMTSRLLISNESFPAHLAVQTKTNCIVVSNGNNYLRFHPYPQKYLNSKYIIIYPKSFEFNSNQKQLPKIDEITTDDVLQTILKYNL